MLTKVTYIFQMVTTPDSGSGSRIHSGGWTESHWWPGDTITAEQIRGLAVLRANLLPYSATIVGWRRAVFSELGNKLIPGGSSTSKANYIGTPVITDVPQMALMLSVSTTSGRNTSRIALRCIPDGQVVGGEFIGRKPFTDLLSLYTTRLENSSWGFLGRDLDQQQIAVASILGQVLTLAAPGPFVVGDYVRMLNVRTREGKPVIGAFAVATVTNPTTYVLDGLPLGTDVQRSGLVRRDIVKYFNVTSATPNRIVVRKVGRPSESYRGKSSRRRR